MNTQDSSLKDKVLARIEQGEVRMHSRLYFIVQIVAIAVLSVFALAVSAFLINFILFAVYTGGHDSLLGFGTRGLFIFLLIFPWKWLAIDVVLLGLVAVLIRRFRFGYSRSLLFLSFGIIFIAVVLGITLERGTTINDDLLERADHDALPAPLGTFYQSVRAQPPHDEGVFRGIVTVVATTTFSMKHDDLDHDADDTTYVVIPPMGFDLGTISLGDHLYVAGTPTPEGIQAYGIQELESRK